MEIDKLRQEFNQLLDNINNHSERFTSKPHVPSLEMSVVMAKLSKMHETASILKYLLEEKEDYLKKHRVSLSQEVKPESTTEEEIEQPPQIENTTTENIIHKDESPVATTPLQKPTSNLVDVFSLNDRYLYANELFNKSMEAFNGCIKLINNVESIHEANNLINEYKNEYNWDSENEFVQSFIALIERKFI